MSLGTNAIRNCESGSVTIQVNYEQIHEPENKKIIREEAQAVLVEQFRKEVFLCFHVIDTGHAIKENDLEILFMDFSRVEELDESIRDIGFGIMVMRQIIELMKGTMGAEIMSDGGADFWFKVPQYVVSFQPIGDYNKRII